MFQNGSGIVLDAGTNDGLIVRAIGAVASVPNPTTIDFTVNGTAGQAYTVDFYASTPAGGPAGQFLGTFTTPSVCQPPELHGQPDHHRHQAFDVPDRHRDDYRRQQKYLGVCDADRLPHI